MARDNMFLAVVAAFAATSSESGPHYSDCDTACQADARCYAEQYPDLKDRFCPPKRECQSDKLRKHYRQRGEAEGRTYGCPKPFDCSGPSRRTEDVRRSLSCHVSKSGVPHEIELRKAFCKYSNGSGGRTAMTCDLEALEAHLQDHGQLATTCSSDEQRPRRQQLREEALALARPSDPRPELSAIVLTFRNHIKLRLMVDSLARQQTSFAYEVIIADNGCDHGTASVIRGFKARSVGTNITSVSYLPICNNIGYAAGNNAAAKAAANSSSHLLFLNDDIELMPRFIQSLHDLMLASSRGKSQTQPTTAADRTVAAGGTSDAMGTSDATPRVGDGSARSSLRVAGAVGCKLVSQNGSSLLEAGSIIWQDGYALGYGRGKLPHAPEYSFTRPVDYVSGACFLMPRADFARLGGFEVAAYKAYYEDTELQMRIRYQLNKSVWFQPLAIARHHEHGSFGKDAAKQLIAEGRQVFRGRWQAQLDTFHRPRTRNPVGVLKSSDRRLYTMPAVLYVDVLVPRRRYGAGLPRALDNVLILARLGYKVTVAAVVEHTDARAPAEYDTWAEMLQEGVELVRFQDVQRASLCELNDQQGRDKPSKRRGGGGEEGVEESMIDLCITVRLLLKLRPNFYKSIITSRPNIWHNCYRHLAEYCHSPDKQQRQVGVEGIAGTCNCPSGRRFDVGALVGSNYTKLACFGGKATVFPPGYRIPGSLVRNSRRQPVAAPPCVGMGVACGITSPARAGIRRRPTCELIYDAEALWFRRDERLVQAAAEKKTSAATLPQVKVAVKTSELARSQELSLLYAADAIITVSKEEAEYARGVLPLSVPVTVVGHSPPAVAISTAPFTLRTGILLVAGFHGRMYYNGDAAWYLVTQVYPLIAEAAARDGLPPIPLTIAGSGIPQDLVAAVSASRQREWITLKHSPRELAPLYNAARVIVVPHQYGCGVQYKLSEAMAYGVPAVVSQLAANGVGFSRPESNHSSRKRRSFGDFDHPPQTLCVGTTTAQLAQCAVQLHSDSMLWQELRRGGLHFAREVQSADVWAHHLNRALHISTSKPMASEATCERWGAVALTGVGNSPDDAPSPPRKKKKKRQSDAGTDPASTDTNATDALVPADADAAPAADAPTPSRRHRRRHRRAD